MKTFEEKLQRLEELSSLIKNRDMPLDDAVKSFEEGVKLAAQLEKELQRVERKVEILLNEPDPKLNEKPHLELFDDQD